jgi:hypothetical protein
VGDHDAHVGLQPVGRNIRQFSVKRCATAGAAQGDTFPSKFFPIQPKPGSTGWTFNNHQQTSQKNDRASDDTDQVRRVVLFNVTHFLQLDFFII